MPLLGISLLVLLLLPLSLSCDIPPFGKIRGDYENFIKPQLQRTREEITTLLQSSNCTGLINQPPSCVLDSACTMDILYKLNCKMYNLLGSHSNEQLKSLPRSLLDSIRCPCPEKPTKKPKAISKRRRETTRRRRDDRTRKGKETRKLRRAQEILCVMTECYQSLNSS